MSIYSGVTDGISSALYGALKTPTYTDFAKQNIIFPCFRIFAIEPEQDNHLINRYRRTYNFDIQYFHDENGEIEDYEGLMSLADDLFFILEVITIGNGVKVRAQEMSHRITDGVLHFFVTYEFFIDRIPKDVKMETLDQDWGVKNGNNEERTVSNDGTV